MIPQRYDFSSKSQRVPSSLAQIGVVVDTTKVRFFKQITTGVSSASCIRWLLLIPQRYDFSSKSQLKSKSLFNTCQLLLIPQRYDFSSKSQQLGYDSIGNNVVVDTTKVRFFKQITTQAQIALQSCLLLLIPQRYDFSSKSQLLFSIVIIYFGCC